MLSSRGGNVNKNRTFVQPKFSMRLSLYDPLGNLEIAVLRSTPQYFTFLSTSLLWSSSMPSMPSNSFGCAVILADEQMLLAKCEVIQQVGGQNDEAT